MEHPIDGTYPTAHITMETIEQVLKNFIGEIKQIPPAYSACKVDGKRAYKMMRKGEEVNLKEKTLRIDEIDVISFDKDQMRLTLRVVCSKGTYIRALARDIGVALNSGAYLVELCRTRVGNTKIENCITLDGFQDWLDKQDIEVYQPA